MATCPNCRGEPNEVRASEGLKALPFMMITAESAAKNVLAARAASVNAYLIKPLNARTLKQRLVSLFGRF